MYLVNTREHTTFTTIQDELSLDPHKNYLFDLSYLSSLDLIGPRSGEFLQGQLSCDVRDVTPSQMRQGVMCNLKGRILALLDVVDWHGIHLIVPNDLLADTQASLAKTAAFSQVKLSPNSTCQVMGFYLQNHNDNILFDMPLPIERYGVVYNDHGCAYHLGNGYYIVLISSSMASSLCEPFIQKNQWRGSLAWHVLQLRRLQVDVYPNSRGLFLPHRLGLHLSGYLNFNKGCYKGQEIIARTHYRAKLKHEMKRFTIQTNKPLQSGLKLISDAIEVGELIDFCPINENEYLCAASVVLNCPTVCQLEGHEANMTSDIKITDLTN